MFVKLAQRVASIGWVFDLSQALAGAAQIRRRLRSHVELCPPGSRILDVGGGTGTLQNIVPKECTYVCLDLEMPKLTRYVEKTAYPNPLLADATCMPIRTGSVDLVTCVFIAHHLTDEMLADVLRESDRVLKDDGRILLIDPVDNPLRWAGKLLWKLDRGSYPRTADKLQLALRSRFRIEHSETFSIYHEYMLAVAGKPGA
jgi:ubiquinone/menaquinone biosynthesis C-methylase UbiE